MQSNKSSQDIPAEHLKTINSVKFTRREIDIIACLLSGRAVKAIASFLSIAPRTVETHMRNIMRKLECNSQEGIRKFVEKSDKFSAIKAHYLSLLTENTFIQQLQEISIQTNKKSPRCLIIYNRYQATKSPDIYHLEKHLKRAGIKIWLEDREKHKGLTSLLRTIDSLQIDFIIYLVSEPWIAQLQADESKAKLEVTQLGQRAIQNPGSIIFLLQRRDTPIEIPQELNDMGYIDFEEQENYYFPVFELLKRVFPNSNLEAAIAEFKKQYEVIHGSIQKPTQRITSDLNEFLQQKDMYNGTLLNIFKKGQIQLFIGGILCLCILYIGMHTFTGNKAGKPYQENIIQDAASIRSDLTLPTEATLLQRPQLIAQIGEKLSAQQGIKTVALIGVGGAGKTTVARQYAYSQKSPVVWEINAETKESLIGSFENLAHALSKTEADKKKLKELQEIKNPKEREDKIILFVKERLKIHPNWFLIYDNIEKFTDIQKYFPSDSNTWGSGQIIVTTRDYNIHNNSHINKILHIQELEPNDKLALFTNIIKRDQCSFTISQIKEVKAFLAKLPPYPLDISVAAYYLKATDVHYKTYLEKMNQGNKCFVNIQEKLLKEAGDYTKTRYEIIALSIQHLIKTHKDFVDLLLIISMLDSQNIPRELLNKYKHEDVVDNFIYNLRKYSLITSESTPIVHSLSAFSIHRSTQEIILAYLIKTLNLGKNTSLLLIISNTLKKYLVQVIDEEDLSKMNLLVRHCERFLAHNNLLTDMMKGAVSGELGYIYFWLGNYIKAKQLLEECFANLNKYVIANSQRAQILLYLGIVNIEMNELEKAKNLLERSLLIYKKYSPGNHLGIARALTHLGNTYKELGDYKKAKNLLDQSLMIYKAYHPDNHVGIARALGYQGIIYRSLGNYKKAKDLLEQSLIIYKKHIPKDSIGISWALAYLGNVHRELGNYKKAKDLLEQSLIIYEKNFSPDYIDVAWVLIYLASVYRELGDYEKAKDLLLRTITINKKNFPENHIRIAWPLAYLGNIYSELGDYEKAKNLLGQCLVIYKKNFSPNHISVARTISYLGNVYKELGDYEKAKKLLEQSLAVYEINYGKDHIETARILKNLGQVHLLKEYNIEIAENLLSKSLEIFQRNKHPEVYSVLENFAELYLKRSIKASNAGDKQQSKKFKNQAINYLNQALEIVKVHFSSDSPHITKLQSKFKEFDNNFPTK